MSTTQALDVHEAVELFIRGAKTLHVGYYLDVRALEKNGIGIIGRAARAIDAACPTGRDPSLPLFEHREEGVRTVAAAALWQSHRERAISVLPHVDLYGLTEAGGLAMKILMFQGRFNPCPSDPRYAHLCEDKTHLGRWLNLDFRDRVLKGETPNDVGPQPPAETPADV